MFGRDVEFIGDSRVAGEGFEWDVSDHECGFEELRRDVGGGDEGLGIHFWVESGRKMGRGELNKLNSIGKKLLLLIHSFKGCLAGRIFIGLEAI
jgi:hypothetical protein